MGLWYVQLYSVTSSETTKSELELNLFLLPNCTIAHMTQQSIHRPATLDKC